MTQQGYRNEQTAAISRSFSPGEDVAIITWICPGKSILRGSSGNVALCHYVSRRAASALREVCLGGGALSAGNLKASASDATGRTPWAFRNRLQVVSVAERPYRWSGWSLGLRLVLRSQEGEAVSQAYLDGEEWPDPREFRTDAGVLRWRDDLRLSACLPVAGPRRVSSEGPSATRTMRVVYAFSTSAAAPSQRDSVRRPVPGRAKTGSDTGLPRAAPPGTWRP